VIKKARKLGLAHDQHLHQARAGIAGDDNRRLLAVLAYLNA
jgi:hypothetical protein